MIHAFDSQVAVEYGLNEAIILNHFRYWISHNAANEKNFYDGRYWTYNSNSAFCNIFPYLSERKIRNALKHLQEEGIIMTGNYNKSLYDRTLWYAFTDEGARIFLSEQKGTLSIQQKSQMDYLENDKPIPYINTDYKTDSSPYNPPKDEREESKRIESNSSKNDDYCNDVVSKFISICSNLQKPQKLTPKRKRAILKAKKDIEEFGGWEKYFSCVASSQFLNGKSKHGWKADFDWILKPDNMVKIMEGNYQNNFLSKENEIPSEDDYDVNILFR